MLAAPNIQTGAVSSGQELVQGWKGGLQGAQLAGRSTEGAGSILGLCASAVHMVATCIGICLPAPGLRAKGT